MTPSNQSPSREGKAVKAWAMRDGDDFALDEIFRTREEGREALKRSPVYWTGCWLVPVLITELTPKHPKGRKAK